MKPGLRKHKKRQARIAKTLKKVEGVTRTDLDRTFHEQLAAIKQQREERLASAANEYRTTVKDACDAHTAARADAWQEYDERREAILRSLAPSQDERVAA